MSSFALPPRPQAKGQARPNNKSSNTNNPLREHVNVYSAQQNNGGSGRQGAKGRVGGYGAKEDAELLAQMGQMGLKVKYPSSKPPSPAITQTPQLPSSALRPEDAIAFMHLQQAQIDAAASNPTLQSYLIMQAQAQRATLLAQLQQQQLETQLLLSAANSPRLRSTSPTPLANSTFMPPPPIPTAKQAPSKTDRSAFAAQVQARTKAREAAQAAKSAHVRSISVSSTASAQTGASKTSPVLSDAEAKDLKPVTPVIRITPALPAHPHFAPSLGLGRPSGAASTPRLASSPALGASPRLPDSARSVSMPVSTGSMQGVRVVRQPHGPPAPAAELGDRNFQSCIRKKAGLNLGVLGRRVESSTAEE